MKMKIHEVIDKIRYIDTLIKQNENEGDTATANMLREYQDDILDTTVDI